MRRYIAIEGNIGAGKTTVARLLAERMNARLVLERFADNPFLPQFYTDRAKYAFPLEMSFLADRYRQALELFHSDLFAERTISDFFFAKSMLFARINLAQGERELFKEFYSILESKLPNPELIVYLNRPMEVLQQNIQRRGRSYEAILETEYLKMVQESYMDYLRQVADIPVLVVHCGAIDFTTHGGALLSLEMAIKSAQNQGVTHIEL
jgi:deoxyadenosine/deoxycytidine kinase